MPLKLGLPSTRARARGAGLRWLTRVRVIDTEMTAPTAAAAMATVIIEPKYAVAHDVSFSFCFVLFTVASYALPAWQRY